MEKYLKNSIFSSRGCESAYFQPAGVNNFTFAQDLELLTLFQTLLKKGHF